MREPCCAHQGSLRSQGAPARLFWLCCDTHRVRLAAPTGTMAFLKRGDGGGSSRRGGVVHVQTAALSV